MPIQRLARALAAAALAAIPSLALAQPAPMDDAMREKLNFARALSDVFQRAAEIIEPSVVHITTQQRALQRGAGMRTRTVLRQGLGSGVVLTPDGYILTNNHVVENADRLVVKFSDRRELEAEIVGLDPDTDLAVLKVDATSLQPASFAIAPVEVGEWVLAAGSPFGLTSSVTAGIVSATGRTGLVNNSDSAYEDFIQTDASVNPGNSGGPLINLDGQVAGINTAIFSRSGGSNGISFAIPASIAERVVADLIDRGEVARGFLGVTFTSVTPELARSRDLDEPVGVYIQTVQPNSPADRSGLRAGDVVTTLNGRRVDDRDRFRTLIGLARPGDRLPATILRNNRPVSLGIEIGSQRDDFIQKLELRAAANNAVAVPDLGIIIKAIPEDDAEDLARRLDLDDTPAVYVDFVDPKLAEQGTFRRGDVLTAIDRNDIDDPREFVRDLTRGAERVYLVRREGRSVGKYYVPLDN